MSAFSLEADVAERLLAALAVGLRLLGRVDGGDADLHALVGADASAARGERVAVADAHDEAGARCGLGERGEEGESQKAGNGDNEAKGAKGAKGK